MRGRDAYEEPPNELLFSHIGVVSGSAVALYERGRIMESKTNNRSSWWTIDIFLRTVAARIAIEPTSG